MHAVIHTTLSTHRKCQTEAGREVELLAELQDAFRKRRRARRVLRLLRWMSARRRRPGSGRPGLPLSERM